MSKKTRARRIEKEENRLEARYESPVKFKPRELAWKLYKETGQLYGRRMEEAKRDQHRPSTFTVVAS